MKQKPEVIQISNNYCRTLEDNWADFGSDLPLLTFAGVLPIRGWSEQIIGPNYPIVCRVYRRNVGSS